MAPSAPAQQPAEPRAYLGVSTRSLTDADKRPRQAKHGAVVTQVMDGSPAAKLGLKEGDIITEVDGKTVDGPAALTDLVRARQPGEEVKLAWLREGKAMKGAAQLAPRKADPYGFGFSHEDLEELGRLGDPLAWLGERRAFLGVTPGEHQGDAPGAPVGTVEEGSAAERMGLRPGDRITAINGEPVNSFDSLAQRIRGMKPGDTI
ncbi:MAG: PDZ domain-containing protein, partial [Flavobacteriales bacterium]